MIRIRHLNHAAIIALTGAMLAGLAAPAVAGTTPDSENRQAAAAQAEARHSGGDDQRRICVRTELTGSRVQRTICKTAAQWEAEGGLPTGR